MSPEQRVNKFEEWCADEMGNTVLFIRQMRSIGLFGEISYKRDEINKRYRAWCAALRCQYLNK